MKSTSPCRLALVGASLFAMAAAPIETHADAVGYGAMYFDSFLAQPQNGSITWGPTWNFSVESSLTDAFGTIAQSDSGSGTFYEVYVETLYGVAAATADIEFPDSQPDPIAGVGAIAGTDGSSPFSSGFSRATISSTFTLFPGLEGGTETDVFFESWLESDIFLDSQFAGIGSTAATFFRILVGTDIVLQFEDSQGIGSEDFLESSYWDYVSLTRTLNFNQEYTLTIELGADAFAESGIDPVPEASSILATGLGVGLLAAARLRRRLA